jgi:hypothetical protein
VCVGFRQQVKVNGEVYLVTCHSGIQEARGVTILFSYPWCWIGWVVITMPQPLYPTKEPWYPLYRRPVGQRDWSDGCGKSLPHWGSHPESSTSKQVSILIMPPQLHRLNNRKSFMLRLIWLRSHKQVS